MAADYPPHKPTIEQIQEMQRTEAEKRLKAELAQKSPDQIRKEINELRELHNEREKAKIVARDIQRDLKEVGYILSQEDRKVFQQEIATYTQQAQDIAKQWQGEPYHVPPGRDSLETTLKLRAEALGEPHRKLEYTQPEPTMSPLPQDAVPPLTAQEMIKNMTAHRDAFGHAQDILNIQTVRLSDLAQKHLAEQQRVAQEGFESNQRAYEAKYGPLPNGSIPKYVHLHEQHTPEQLEQMARDINYKALQDLYTKTTERQALHPEIERTRQREQSGPSR